MVYATMPCADQITRLVAGPMGGWRVEQLSSQSSAQPPTVLQRLWDGMAGAARAEGWGHIMDGERCLAVAVDSFGRSSVDSLSFAGDGAVTIQRRWKDDEAASDGHDSRELRCWFHFVPVPPHRSAATQPQAMLAPPRAVLRPAL